MQGVTLLIAFTGSLLVLFLKPIWGLFVFLLGLCWYSQILTVPLGTIDFTVSRIIILTLLANILFRTKLLREFKWNLMDTFVLAYVFGRLIALTQNVSAMIFLEREGGRLFDTILPYFAARFVINSKANLHIFIKMLVIVAIPLAVLGVYQSLTGHNPVGFMVKHYSWGFDEWMAGPAAMRKGFYRANVTFSVSIIFGLFFAGIAPLCLGLWRQKVWGQKSIIIGFVFMLLGVFSSMSSAPLFSIAVSMAMLAIYQFRRFWPAIVVIVLVSILFVEVYSNRHWYEVLTRSAFSKENAYHRIELVKEALGGGMTGHWISGYGYVGPYLMPGTYNIDFNWIHRDITNLYIAILATYGLLGFLPFLAINILYYQRLYLAGSITLTRADLWLVWCIMSTLVGWNVAMMTVTAMGQVNTILFVLIGICSNLPGFIGKKSSSLTEIAIGSPWSTEGLRKYDRKNYV